MTDAETKDLPAGIALTGFVYAASGPIQSIPFQVITGENEAAKMVRVTVDLKPGKPCQLPTGHPITNGLLAQKLIQPAEDETGGTAAPAEPADLKSLAPNDTRRVEAIIAALPHLGEGETTTSGKPRIDALERLLGFRPSSGEVEAALAALKLNEDA